MKNLLIALFLTLLASQTSSAQNEFGIKVGLASYDLIEYNISNTSNLNLAVKSSRYGFHGGVYGRLGLGLFYIQPEIIFNAGSNQFTLSEFTTTDTFKQLFSSRYREINIPVLFMINPLIFKLYAGPVGHYFLNSVSDLSDSDKFKEEFKKLSYGYQLGGGITLNKLTLDLRYEGNFSNKLEIINLYGEKIKFNRNPSRVMVSVWLKLF